MKILKNMNLSPEAKRKLELVDKDPMARGQLEELVRKNFIERQNSAQPSNYTTPTNAVIHQSKMH